MTLSATARRDDHDPFAVADDHVARQHRHPAAADRHVDVLRVMDRRRHIRALPGGVRRQIERRDRGRVAKGAIGDDAGRAALHDARRQDVAQCRRARVAARIDDQHVARPDRLDGDALLVGPIVELTWLLEVLAHRDVAQRERPPGHAQVGPQRSHARHERVHETVFLKL